MSKALLLVELTSTILWFPILRSPFCASPSARCLPSLSDNMKPFFLQKLPALRDGSGARQFILELALSRNLSSTSKLAIARSSSQDGCTCPAKCLAVVEESSASNAESRLTVWPGKTKRLIVFPVCGLLWWSEIMAHYHKTTILANWKITQQSQRQSSEDVKWFSKMLPGVVQVSLSILSIYVPKKPRC